MQTLSFPFSINLQVAVAVILKILLEKNIYDCKEAFEASVDGFARGDAWSYLHPGSEAFESAQTFAKTAGDLTHFTGSVALDWPLRIQS